MDIKDLKPDQLADVFRRGQRAAEEEERDAARRGLEEELAATKRQSVEAFDRRAEFIEEGRALREVIEEIRAKIKAEEEALERALKEAQRAGHQHSQATREGQELARTGRRLEEQLGVELEERQFSQHGIYYRWPHAGHASRHEAGLPEGLPEDEEV